MRKLDVNGKLIESKMMFYVADEKKSTNKHIGRQKQIDDGYINKA